LDNSHYIFAEASEQREYERFAEDPRTWAVYYATVGVIAKK